jgi:hypothetical protein
MAVLRVDDRIGTRRHCTVWGFNSKKLNNSELAMSAAFIVAMIGLVVLWKWEGIGGARVVGGMIASYGLNCASSGRFSGG